MITKETSRLTFYKELENLKTNEEKIMFLFNFFEKLTKADIIKKLRISHPTATSRLSALQDKGLIYASGTKKTRRGNPMAIYEKTPESEIERVKAERLKEKKTNVLSAVLKLPDISDNLRSEILNELVILSK